MDAPRRSTSQSDASPASSCPGCGKAIDPLRAGHVAILEGGFRYFCGAECKSSFVDVTSKRAALEAMTAEAPMVSATSTVRPKDAGAPRGSEREEPRSVASGVRSQGRALEETPYFPDVVRRVGAGTRAHESADANANANADAYASEEESAYASEEENAYASEEENAYADEVGGGDEAPGREEQPATLRSKALDAAAVAEAEARASSALEANLVGDEVAPALDRDESGEVAAASVAKPARARTTWKADLLRWLAIGAAAAPVVGIALGVLAFVVSLAGEGSSALRLPLALAATSLLVACSVLRPRDPADSGPWFSAGPVMLGAFGAVVSLALRDPRAEAHAAYVGLAAAGALLVDMLLLRSRRDLVEARSRIAAGLACRVRVVRGDVTSEMDAAHVKPGEQVVVEAGEVVGVDGIVAAGEAEIAPWIDSPAVMAKKEGDAVVAGATVISGRLRITATFTGADRAWLKLGQSHAARVDVAAPLVAAARRTVERGAPVAALVVGCATYANNGGLPEVIVAASAGAYAMAGFAAVAAAGIAHARGHSAAQRRGIVYKDADAFDGAARAEVAVVCSRGTILLGEPEIVVVEAVASRGSSLVSPADTTRVLALAAGAEMASSDAFAAAILRAARARGVRPENVRSALVHSGLGVTALAPNGDKVIVGSRAFLLKEKVSVAIADARVTELEAQGRSVLLVALGDHLVGLFALQDGLRPGARAAVQRLHDARIEPVLLSGEARDTCETIARALDIEHVRPEILPADRGAEVRALADGGRAVAAIGHASSDDGALGAADVSVAMTAAGSAPGEWAVALASDDVRDAALALTVPRACRERAKTALLIGAAAQGLSLLGIAFGAAPPAIAPIAAALTAAVVLAVVREPTSSAPAR